jgi:hypothetical protein
MLFIPAGFAQGAWRFSLSGDPEVMVTTIGIDLDEATPQQAADQFADLWTQHFPGNNMAAGWTYLGATLRVGTGAAPLIVEAPRNVPGTGPGNSLPSNCALLVKKRTALGGRSGRGRMFVPLTSVGEEGVTPNGFMSAALTGVLQGVYTSIWGAMSFVLLHDSLSPVTVPTALTSLIVDPQIATQRRRMR